MVESGKDQTNLEKSTSLISTRTGHNPQLEVLKILAQNSNGKPTNDSFFQRELGVFSLILCHLHASPADVYPGEVTFLSSPRAIRGLGQL